MSRAGGVIAKDVHCASAITAPTHILFEASDAPPLRKGVEIIEQTMRSQNKNIKVIQYARGGGQELFYDLGYRLDDLRTFVREQLSRCSGR
jgi:hypothetical protein